MFAVVGASNDRRKYGNRVLRAYLRHGRTAIPVNPHENSVEGLDAFPDLSTAVANHPGLDRASIITRPDVTERIVEDAIATGRIRLLWMQPGAESGLAIQRARDEGITVIAGGPCVLVELG
jgi:predicted CoA-binding protein